jgi:hypothetical protein
MKNTKTIYKSTQSYLNVVIDLFKFNIIDYKLLTPSVIACIENKNLVVCYQHCISELQL